MVNGPTNMTAIDGKDATIPCEAEGAPTPNITWYLNGKKHFFSLCYVVDQTRRWDYSPFKSRLE